MKQIEDIFLSQLDSEKEAIAEGVDLLSVFDQYFEEGTEKTKLDKIVQGILKLTESGIQTSMIKYSRKLNLGNGINALKKLFTTLQNYSPQGEIGERFIYMIVALYLKTIREEFQASSAGFLFENVVAGLLEYKLNTKREIYDVDNGSEFWSVKFTQQLPFEGSKKNFITHIIDQKKELGFIIGEKSGGGVIKLWIIDPKSGAEMIKNIINTKTSTKKSNSKEPNLFGEAEEETKLKITLQDIKSIKPQPQVFSVNIDAILKDLDNVKGELNELIQRSTSILDNIEEYLTDLTKGKEKSNILDNIGNDSDVLKQTVDKLKSS
jgi:hypothetical protein